MDAVVVASYAKINLTLDVSEKRPDGFHAIESVMQSVSLRDIITLRVEAEPGIRVTCDMPWIPVDERNLAYKAAKLILDRCENPSGISIDIKKTIPVQAGLGGGSSNAAAVLRGLNRLLNLSLGPDALCEIAARIGSDVPFFIIGGTALVQGRGEIVHPLSGIGEFYCLIVKPPFGVSTAWSYNRLDEIRASEDGRVEPNAHSERMVKCIESGDWHCLPGLLYNDLELPAIEQHPKIAEIKDALIDAGAYCALMCGSGSAVFGLFESETSARCADDRLSKFGKVFAAKTLVRDEAGLDLQSL